MANLVSRQSGNLTATTTWKTVETGTRAIQNSFSASTNTTTSDVYNANAEDFTIANLSVIEGVLLYCNRINTTGTVRVTLSQDSGTSATRTVTVNASDLPASPSWVFFEFGSTLTGDGGTDYAIAIQGSSAGNATFFRNATAANWTHLIVTNQNPGSVAAGDVFYVVGELTSAGAGSDFTVTMDSTATTDYGTGTDGTSVNGMEVGKRGILTYGTTAATNYYLKMSGSINVWGDATFNVGTTGTPIPRDSTAVLEFDPVADGGMGFYARNGSTVSMQGLSRTSGKDIIACKLNTDEAAAQTVLGVDTDTGWLNNDDIVIASTTQTASQTEKRTLSGDAGASSFTVSVGLTNAHSGTSPTQAEVILLTRNVKFRSATSTLVTYFNAEGTSIVDLDWVEFRYLGENATDKRAWDVETTTGSFNAQYCSLYDVEDGAFQSTTTTSNTTISNNVFYNTNSTLSAGVDSFFVNATTGTITFSGNYFIGCNGNATNGNVFSGGDAGMIFTNNTFAGCNSGSNTRNVISMGEAAAIPGARSGNTIHSCTGNAVSISTDGVIVDLSSYVVWRNTGAGFTCPFNTRLATLTDCTFFGNTTSNLTLTFGQGRFVFSNLVSSGDSSFSTTNGIVFNSVANAAEWSFHSCDFSTVSGIKTAHTNDINIGTEMFTRMLLSNTKLGGTNEIGTQTNMVSDRSFISSQKHDQTAGLHKTWKKYGTITVDTTTVHSPGTESLKMTPNNASNKLDSSGALGGFKVQVANGQTCTPTIYVYEDGSYNGARARLIVKRNDALGVTSDTVLDTATAASDAAWEGLTGTTAAVTDNGTLEFVIDCNGTAGNLFVGSVSAVVA